MLYAILQGLVVAAALVFSLQHVARRLFPQTFGRLTRAVLPAPLRARVSAVEPEKGCDDSGGCGSCNACGNIAAMLRDLPPR
jgi:hypothetical protein